jgi:hypothetical protein
MNAQTAGHWHKRTESVAHAYLRLKEKGYEFPVDDIVQFAQKHELSKCVNAGRIEKYLKENKLVKQHLSKNLLVKI